jgi:ribosomal protein S18 acetylase RimI-like enzyme
MSSGVKILSPFVRNEVVMKIIKAQNSHVPGIIDVWEEFARFHEPYDPRFPMKDNVREGYQIHINDLIKAEDTLVLVALDNGKVIGYVIAAVRKSSPAFKREKYGHIEEMAVTADYRRKGIGSELLKKILAWFQSQDLDMIELSVAARNPIGYSFWKKHGFKDYLHHLYVKT